MARIRIDDLPVADDLTPEQEALLQGAGLQSFRPSLESLEAREVPAVVSALVDVPVGEGVTVRTLKITGDATENKVTVSQRAGDSTRGEPARVVVVNGTHLLSTTLNQAMNPHQAIYDASKVDEIVFEGGGTSQTLVGGQDTFTNKTGIDYYVSNDVLDRTFAGMSQASSFHLSSPDLTNGRLPNSSASEGGNKAPTLELPDLPPGAKSWALTMEDRSAARTEGGAQFKGRYTHWVVSNIPEGTTKLQMVGGVLQAVDGAGNITNVSQALPYSGPNPGDGKPHTYVFTLYALGQNSNGQDYQAPAQVATQQQLADAMQGHIVGQTELRTIYSK
jgi:Raf kinase inhibitor-like YbhB/YbcL family protein